MKKFWIVRAVKVAFLATLVVGAVSFLVMTLWNALMPGIFALGVITFWQALGLLLLSKLLFGGFRPYGGGGGRQWRRRMMERWEQMTPEERERFKRGMRCGRRPEGNAGYRNGGTSVNCSDFTKIELKAALARGVRQLVLIGSQTHVGEELEALPDAALEVFAVDEKPSPESSITFVSTHFDSEELAAALDRSNFDKLKASLFVWLGASYRSADRALSTLAFIASLPKGSGVLFDYTPERTPLGSLTGTALDALASRISYAGGAVKHLIQPQAVSAMLRGIGFGQMTEYIDPEVPTFEGHLVSALI